MKTTLYGTDSLLSPTKKCSTVGSVSFGAIKNWRHLSEKFKMSKSYRISETVNTSANPVMARDDPGIVAFHSQHQGQGLNANSESMSYLKTRLLCHDCINHIISNNKHKCNYDCIIILLVTTNTSFEKVYNKYVVPLPSPAWKFCVAGTDRWSLSLQYLH